MPFTPTAAKNLNGPDWLKQRRAVAADQLENHSFPSTQEEIWRYSRVEEIDLEKFELVAEAPESAIVPASEIDIVGSIGKRSALVTCVDGHVLRVDLEDEIDNKSVKVGAAEADWESTAGAPDDLFEAMNNAFMTGPVSISVSEGVRVEAPIVVVHRVSKPNGASFPRTVINAGANSEISIIEVFVSDAVDALVAPVSEASVADGAHVSHVIVQALERSVFQVAYNVSSVERDANYSSTTIALGGDYARVRTESNLAGQGSDSKLRAIYFGAGSQMHDFRTLQGHSAPKTTSDLFFKGASGDGAHSVYSGLIRVAKGASGTNAFQTNRNMILSPQSHAESVPNLEIEENDVKCSHASAVGPIDETHRYYLESRGVPRAVADRLIAIGFLDEVLAGMGNPGLRENLRNRIITKLDTIKDLVTA
jgi:Fe-S cluster assembly protein SufD